MIIAAKNVVLWAKFKVVKCPLVVYMNGVICCFFRHLHNKPCSIWRHTENLLLRYFVLINSHAEIIINGTLPPNY